MRELEVGLHAVRGSLAVIRGQCFNVARAEGPAAQGARLIDAEVERILREIERIVGRGSEDPPAPRRIRSIAAEVVLRHLPAAEARGIALRLREGPADPGIGAEGERLRIALDNLVQNAIRHCSRDGEIVVAIGATRRGARISVRNDGTAPAPRALSRLFAPGERGDSPRGDGWGLGLAIVAREAAACGGTVVARSVEGGCVFAIDLPAGTS